MNLRELLGREFASTIDETVAANTSLERNHEGRVFLFHPYCNESNCESSYRGYCLQYWCVPCGTTQATFELWGGGVQAVVHAAVNKVCLVVLEHT